MIQGFRADGVAAVVSVRFTLHWGDLFTFSWMGFASVSCESNLVGSRKIRTIEMKLKSKSLRTNWPEYNKALTSQGRSSFG